MIEWLKILEQLPFVVAGTKHPHINGGRVIESILIALMTALVLKVLAIDGLRIEIENLKQDVAAVKTQIAEMRHDLYEPKGH